MSLVINNDKHHLNYKIAIDNLIYKIATDNLRLTISSSISRNFIVPLVARAIL